VIPTSVDGRLIWNMSNSISNNNMSYSCNDDDDDDDIDYMRKCEY